MLQIVLLAGKFILLIILYLFIYRVVRSTTRELRMSGAAAGLQSARGPVPPRVGESTRGLPGVGPGTGGITWSLVVVKSPSLHPGETYPFPPGTSAVIGRAPEMDIHLDDTFVSSKHAAVETTAGLLAIEDLHSTNGTVVNGQEITGTHELHAGDRVEIGDTVFQVEVR
ncbi:MAG: FHA domain-containing protein [Actinobacteria bacterium]|nr:FHA domain-containing protein [Actinomycetota bacterium]